MGRSSYDGRWSDFGGGMEKCDKNNPQATAIREFYEETIGAVLDLQNLKYIFKNKNYICVNGSTMKGRDYHMYLIHVNYKNYNTGFKKNLQFCTYVHLPQKYKEMNEIRWFSLNSITNNPSVISMRPEFLKTFDTNRDTILQSIQKAQQSRHASIVG